MPKKSPFGTAYMENGAKSLLRPTVMQEALVFFKF